VQLALNIFFDTTTISCDSKSIKIDFGYLGLHIMFLLPQATV